MSRSKHMKILNFINYQRNADKATIKYHYTTSKIAKNLIDQISARMQNWNSYLLVGTSDGTTTLENRWEVSEKVWLYSPTFPLIVT